MQTPEWERRTKRTENFDNNTWNRHHRAAGYFFIVFLFKMLHSTFFEEIKRKDMEVQIFFISFLSINQNKKNAAAIHQIWMIFLAVVYSSFFFVLAFFLFYFILLLWLNGSVSITAYMCRYALISELIAISMQTRSGKRPEYRFCTSKS